MARIAFVTEDKANHRRSYQEASRDLETVDAVALVDSTGATLEESRTTIGAKVVSEHASIGEMLKAGKPDLALVTMIAAHAPPVIQELLEAGVPVMVEKPACTNPDQFAPLAAIAQKRGIPLMLALANRTRPDVMDARRIISEGGIGTLYAVQGMQVDDQTRIQKRKADPDWTLRKQLAGGGHLAWLGIHALDLILHLTGEQVEEVQAMAAVVGGAPIDVEDLALVNMRLRGGARGALFSGYLMDRKGHSNITVYGSEGWVRINPAEQGTLEWRTTGQSNNGAPDRITRYPERGGGYTVWVDAVVRACLGERPVPLTPQESLHVLQVVHAAYESSSSGANVKLT